MSRFSITNRVESGASIANPTGLKIIEPVASKAETRESESRGNLWFPGVLFWLSL
jgi:hypothetical protein